jgi:hypothetical protein
MAYCCLLCLQHFRSKWNIIRDRFNARGGVGETRFSWHTFNFLIFYNFRRNDTEKKMVLAARVILRLCKKIY